MDTLLILGGTAFALVITIATTVYCLKKSKGENSLYIDPNTVEYLESEIEEYNESIDNVLETLECHEYGDTEPIYDYKIELEFENSSFNLK